MAFLVLPNFPDQGRHEYSTEIDGADYTLEFTFHVRLQSWYMEIRDSTDNIIRTGIRVVADYPLLFRSQLESLPRGRLLSVDVSGEAREIETQSDLGDRVQLVFIPADELDPEEETEGLIFDVVTPP